MFQFRRLRLSDIRQDSRPKENTAHLHSCRNLQDSPRLAVVCSEAVMGQKDISHLALLVRSDYLEEGGLGLVAAVPADKVDMEELE
jgi:hypothetical protein